ncbi:MAG: sugar ABC transporter ATP-binding protein [Treponema sp.]|jgi:ribose transport system ATP-binding protein|nr:sugar ABC transporter ATP-binding protein [Treponema sp.]
MAEGVFLSVKDATKQYGSVTVLNKVSVDFYRGEVHALIGENGAGKSTICKIIAGAVTPTAGSLIVDGKPHYGLNPQSARAAGISMVYQEFNLIPEMTVYENLFVGKELHRGGFSSTGAMIRESGRIFDEMGVVIKAQAKIKYLSVAYCQLVEIAKALLDNSKLLILDEPTATLTNNEVEILFRVLGKLKRSGISLIYISHRLEEIFRLCDKITVLRDGCFINTMQVRDTTMDELIRLMIGRELSQEFPGRVPRREEENAAPVLRVENLNSRKIKNVSFLLNKGEILGIAGLVGSGRSETVRAVFGADKVDSGKIFVHGRETVIRNPAAAIRNGMALIPEDRKREGLMPILSIMHNISIVVIRELCKSVFVSTRREKELIDHSKELLSIKTASMGNPVRSLSGGNQQKIVLAKWLASDADILIFDEPTRGIDVGAKKEIYDFLFRLKSEGKSLIVISSEMQEILGLCDRILVMHEGAVQGELNYKEATQEKILSLASGIKTGSRP